RPTTRPGTALRNPPAVRSRRPRDANTVDTGCLARRPRAPLLAAPCAAPLQGAKAPRRPSLRGPARGLPRGALRLTAFGREFGRGRLGGSAAERACTPPPAKAVFE